MDEAALTEDRRKDWRRASVAWAVAKETSVPHAWIAEELNLKSAANASQQIRRFQLEPEKSLPKEVRTWKRSRNVAFSKRTGQASNRGIFLDMHSWSFC